MVNQPFTNTHLARELRAEECTISTAVPRTQGQKTPPAENVHRFITIKDQEGGRILWASWGMALKKANTAEKKGNIRDESQNWHIIGIVYAIDGSQNGGAMPKIRSAWPGYQ